MFLSILVAAAVLATAFVSVRLHLHVTQRRYRLWAHEQDRVRAERAHRTARADLEADKAPRRLMERWAAMRATALAVTPHLVPVQEPIEAPQPEIDVEGLPAPSPEPERGSELEPELPDDAGPRVGTEGLDPR